jgi:hypothetical protein
MNMRKAVTFIFCCLPIGLQALYNANPAEPELIYKGLWIPESSIFDVKLGYQGDFLFSRKMKTTGGGQGHIDRFKTELQQAVLTFVLSDLISMYGSCGTIRGKIANHHFGSQPAFGGGMRAILMHWSDTVLGINGGVQATRRDRFRYLEWQAGVGLAHEFSWLTPYLAAFYSVIKAHVKHDFKAKNRERFGLAAGCTLTHGEFADLNLEGRLFSEYALSVAVNLKF